MLQLDLKRVQLRKCHEPDSVCVEVAVRARLTDRRSGQVIYEATPVYTSPEAVPTGGYALQPAGYAPLPHHALWETPAATPAQGHVIEAICAGDGLALFRSELDKGLRAIADSIAADLTSGERSR